MGDKAYKDRHRKLGLCGNCSEPVYKSRALCLKHLRNNVASTKKYEKSLGSVYYKRHSKIKQHRQDTNRCRRCGAPLDDDPHKNCVNCRENIMNRRCENANIIV